VQGHTVPDPAFLDRLGPFSHTIHVQSETGYYETCNMAYRRSVLEQVGGFDETFRFPYGEDTDLAWRAKEAGAKTAFAGDAVVFHDVLAPPFRTHRAGIRRREGLVHAMSLHPQLRQSIRLGLFFRATHPPAIAALISALALAGGPRRPRRWLLAVLAGAWYTYACRWNTIGPARKAQWLGVVPQRFVSDTYEVAVLARASARHRTLLL
jgi:GT2 family glycosyltransferase